MDRVAGSVLRSTALATVLIAVLAAILVGKPVVGVSGWRR